MLLIIGFVVDFFSNLLEVNPSPEPIAFMRQIISVLSSAGWKWLSRTDTGGIGVSGPDTPVAAISGAFVGFGIAIDNEQEGQWLEAVMTLSNALAAEGIHVQVATKARMPPNAIHIVVGTKQ